MFLFNRLSSNLLFTSRFYFSSKPSPYQVLGVKPTATQQQIKKAYRQLAQRYHPDKNPNMKDAEKKFLSAKEAYQTLIDEDKRRQFDSQHGIGRGRSGYGFEKDPFDQFNSDIFKDKSRVYHETYTAGPARMRKGDDIEKQIQISFLDSVKGTKIKLQFQRKDTCRTCNGNKCQPGTAPTRCLSCGGSGTTMYRQMSMVIHMNCERCRGHGVLIKHPCPECKAVGVKVAKVEQQFQIPTGVDNGEKITFKQKGNQSQHGPSGDLHLKVTVEKHPRFRRSQNNIETTEWITISQAALGSKRKIDTIWGQKEIDIKAGTQDGTKSKIRGQGIKKGILDQGDHVCVFRIKVPTSLTARQRQIFEQLSKEQKSTAGNDDEYTKSEEQKQKQKNEANKAFQKFKDMFK